MHEPLYDLYCQLLQGIGTFSVDEFDAILRTFEHHPGCWVGCLALLPDGLRFVSGSGDNTARIAYHGLAPV